MEATVCHVIQAVIIVMVLKTLIVLLAIHLKSSFSKGLPMILVSVKFHRTQHVQMELSSNLLLLLRMSLMDTAPHAMDLVRSALAKDQTSVLIVIMET